jgi:hypothetical protein
MGMSQSDEAEYLGGRQHRGRTDRPHGDRRRRLRASAVPTCAVRPRPIAADGAYAFFAYRGSERSVDHLFHIRWQAARAIRRTIRQRGISGPHPDQTMALDRRIGAHAGSRINGLLRERPAELNARPWYPQTTRSSLRRPMDRGSSRCQQAFSSAAKAPSVRR